MIFLRFNSFPPADGMESKGFQSSHRSGQFLIVGRLCPGHGVFQPQRLILGTGKAVIGQYLDAAHRFEIL